MRITILADTHMPRMAKIWPPALLPYLERADHILHAGDIQDSRVLDSLAAYAPVTAVFGNMDSSGLMDKLPKKQLLDFHGLKIGLTHGHGKGKTTEQRAKAEFEGEAIDLLIYGHSHIPVHKEESGLVLFNPGSPTDKRQQEQFSFGELIVEEDGTWSLKHIFYKDKKG
ncbi:metallophosphoesterase family protein [Terribacillus sp. 7520-G]|uniref:metallophosphoesterase family protein n=1 Tax=Terribacillus TaxID=459532 RepID=UPI0018EA2790|nr:metallophosphoesterase family protein [Terribacillus sp. 7520-G]